MHVEPERMLEALDGLSLYGPQHVSKWHEMRAKRDAGIAAEIDFARLGVIYHS